MVGSKEKRERRARARGAGLFERLGLGRETPGLAGEASQRIREMLGLLSIGLALWLCLALISYEGPDGGGNWGGQAGSYVAAWAFAGLGWSAFSVVVLACTWGAVLVARKSISMPLV